jgi:hypothetical protein
MGRFCGKTLICIEEFFIFEKKVTYYCTREDDKYFYVMNNTGRFGVQEFKISNGLKSCFKIRRWQ